MTTCKCGKITLHTSKKIQAKKAKAKQVAAAKVRPLKNPSKASIKATKIATKKANIKAAHQKNPFAKGCNCN